MKTGLFDSHAHLNDTTVFSSTEIIQNILKDCDKNGVTAILCCATDIADTKKAFNLSCIFNSVFCAGGVHPNNAVKIKHLTNENINYLKKIAKFKKMVAIGEIGLDFVKINSEEEKKVQKVVFIQQMRLAEELNKPVIIHTRGCHQETKKILRDFPNVNGVIHCFSGSFEDATDYIDLGYYISFSGIITFTNSFAIQEVVKKIPINKILIETDSPYLAPQAMRGKTNNPNFVNYVAKQISQLKKIRYNDIVEITFLNSCKLFKIN